MLPLTQASTAKRQQTNSAALRLHLVQSIGPSRLAPFDTCSLFRRPTRKDVGIPDPSREGGGVRDLSPVSSLVGSRMRSTFLALFACQAKDGSARRLPPQATKHAETYQSLLTGNSTEREIHSCPRANVDQSCERTGAAPRLDVQSSARSAPEQLGLIPESFLRHNMFPNSFFVVQQPHKIQLHVGGVEAPSTGTTVSRRSLPAPGAPRLARVAWPSPARLRPDNRTPHDAGRRHVGVPSRRG